MAQTKHTILNNMDDYYMDFEFFKECYLKNYTDEIDENWDDEYLREIFDEEFNIAYECECSNLDIKTNEIIAIADLGFWDGRKNGYRMIGCNIKNCLGSFDCEYYEVYVDGRKNLRGTYHHHDGTNYILFREFKDDMSEEQKDNFRSKIYCGTVTQKDITRYTKRLGDRIGKVYGW